jgi:hypothetical protein
MKDSGLWKRGILLLALVGVIATVALVVALRRPSSAVTENAPVCPEFLTPMLCVPAAAGTAPFPAAYNWGVLQQVAQNSPSPKGWEIRYNATLALARKGSPNLPFDIAAEMLDEKQQMLNFSMCLKNGKMAVDEAAARRTVINALEAIVEWYKHPDRPKKFAGKNADEEKKYEAGFAQVTQAVEQLSESANNVLRTEAIKALQVLREK